MTTSLNNTKLIEKYIDGSLPAGDRLLCEIKIMLNPNLKTDVFYQKNTRHFIKMYHRQKRREEIEAIHRKLFSDPGKKYFQRAIQKLFNHPQP